MGDGNVTILREAHWQRSLRERGHMRPTLGQNIYICSAGR